MKLEQLKYFIAAAKHQHIGKAADEVAISPSAICHSIRALEEEFGQSLFNKRGKHIYLTDAGKILQEQGQQLLTQTTQIKQKMQRKSMDLKGRFQIAGTHNFCAKLLVPAWLTLQKRYPKLQANIYSLRSAEVIERVIAGKLDLGVCLAPHHNPGFKMHVIKSEQLVITLSKTHPILELPATRRITALSSYAAAMPQFSQAIESCAVHPALQQFKISPNIEVTYDNYEVASALVSRSDLWTLMPESIARQYSETLVTIQLKAWDAPYKIALIWHPEQHDDQLIQAIISELENTAE